MIRTFFHIKFILLFSSISVLHAQPVSLSDCWDKSRLHYPLNDSSKELLDERVQESLRNISSKWYPQFELGAQLSYQSDVPHVDLSNPLFDLPMAPKDQYRIFLDISQTIYDGGYSKSNKKLVGSEGKAEQYELEARLLEVKMQLTDVYFSLLMLAEHKKQLLAYIEDLDARIRELSTAVKNEMLHITELDLLEVEKMKAEKQLIDLSSSESALLDILSLYTGSKLTQDIILEIPDEGLFSKPEIRPELKVFESQFQQLEAQQSLNTITNRPQLAAFAQAGYGNPGLNMLKDDFDTYFTVGLRFRWKPWDWRNTSRNKNILNLKSSLLQQHESSFELELQKANYQLKGEIQKYKQKMEKDADIVLRHNQIVSHYQVRLKNGIITSADYIAALNASSRAQLEMQVNRLLYLQMLAKQYLVGRSAEDDI